MHSIFTGVQFWQTNAGSWVEAMRSNVPIAVPLRSTIDSFHFIDSSTQHQMTKALPESSEAVRGKGSLLGDSSVLEFSKEICQDLSNPLDVLNRLRVRISFKYFLATDHLLTIMMDRFGEDIKFDGGEYRKMSKAFENLRRGQSNTLADMLLSDRVALHAMITCDFWEHRLNQARILSFHDSQLAAEFLFQDVPVFDREQPIPEMYQHLGEVTRRSDLLFSGLMTDGQPGK